MLPTEDTTPPRNELPFLDTDIGRANFLMTTENFAFFLQEFGLVSTAATGGGNLAAGGMAAPSLGECLGDATFVLTQFIEIGGDHLDWLIHGASRATPW